MRKGNLTPRIENIYQWIEHWGDASAENLSQSMNEPIGTISACLSYMVKCGYLYRNNRLYTIRVKQDPREVALKIRGLIRENKMIKKERELIRQRSLFSQSKKEAEGVRPEMPLNAPSIEAAVELLKSKGYKILAPVTEFKEI